MIGGVLLGTSVLFGFRESLYFHPTVIENDELTHPKEKWIGNINGILLTKRKNNKVIIFCHGNAGHIYSPGRIHHANKLHELGYDVFSFDYPGFGKSHGTATCESVLESARTVMNYFHLKKKKISLYGESIGCPVAAQMSAEFKVDKLILQSGPCSIGAMVNTYVPLLGSLCDEFDTCSSVNDSNAKKIIIMHSKEDEIISFEHAEQIFLNINPKVKDKEIIEIRGSHNGSIIPYGLLH